MKVWKERRTYFVNFFFRFCSYSPNILRTGDEMVSDSYKMEMIFQDACLEVQAKFVTKGNDNVQIACDDEQEDDGEGETVINIVDAHRLNELQLSKKDCMTMLKAYLKKVVGHLKENGVGMLLHGAEATVLGAATSLFGHELVGAGEDDVRTAELDRL